MPINRDIFFPLVRATVFGNKMTQSQVDGLALILDAFERDKPFDDLRKFAYTLATVKWETASAMVPVVETRQPGEKSNPDDATVIARLDRAWAQGKMPWVLTKYWAPDKDGLSWFGRGYPQLTHKENYLRATVKLQARKFLAINESLVVNPKLALRTDIACAVLFYGMAEGWFTGKKLGDYINGTCNYKEARRIINGTQAAAQVAVLAEQFEHALDMASNSKALAVSHNFQPAAVEVAKNTTAEDVVAQMHAQLGRGGALDITSSAKADTTSAREKPPVPNATPTAAKGTGMDNIFGSIVGQLFSSTAVPSLLRKGATIGLTALAAKVGVSDHSWVPGAASMIAAGGVAIFDWLKSTPSQMVQRTASIPGVSVTLPNGKTLGKS